MHHDLFNIIKTQLPFAITETDFNIGKKFRGKVRDTYDLGDEMVIVTTDRISAFDRVLGAIPFKGEILNNMTLYWFEKTADIIPNHIIKKLNMNSILVKKCKIVPIEVIVRGYLTGSGWREYSKTGMVSGIKLPAGLKKDCKLEKPIITPTTKAVEGHDQPISVEEILKQKLVSEDLMQEIQSKAIKLFEAGQEIVRKNNLILVDTKYEFGTLADNSLILADEIHTSDSSRYWYADTYQELFEAGKPQRMLDKEYLREWLMSQGFTGDGDAPNIPFEVIFGVCKRYLEAYETIIGEDYPIENSDAAYLLKEAIMGLNKK